MKEQGKQWEGNLIGKDVEGLQQLLSDFLALHPTVEVVVREQQLALFNQVRDSLSELSRSFEHLKYLK